MEIQRQLVDMFISFPSNEGEKMNMGRFGDSEFDVPVKRKK